MRNHSSPIIRRLRLAVGLWIVSAGLSLAFTLLCLGASGYPIRQAVILSAILGPGLIVMAVSGLAALHDGHGFKPVRRLPSVHR